MSEPFVPFPDPALPDSPNNNVAQFISRATAKDEPARDILLYTHPTAEHAMKWISFQIPGLIWQERNSGILWTAYHAGIRYSVHRLFYNIADVDSVEITVERGKW